MDRETLDHIFEPFYTTKDTGKGTGLGLAMVYGIVKNHGGYIMCYSEPGQGATFKIYLPVIEGEALEEKERAPAIGLKGGTETILLVDDETAILDIAGQILRRFGYRVAMAQSGEEALEKIREGRVRPDLVILDLNMPGMGGHKCLEKLLEIDPSMKVLIASGYSANGSVKKTLSSGAAGFVEKPYALSDLIRKVRTVLDA